MTNRYTPEKKSVGNLLSMTNPPIVVPEWQRSYSWTTTEVQTFWEDLLQFEAQYPDENINDQEYFLGSIVIVDNTVSHLLLDGQQRLATSAILLSVIRDFLTRYNRDAATRLSARYLTDFDDGQNKTTYKLTLNNYDRDFFRREVLELRDGGYVPVEPELASHQLIRTARSFFIDQFETYYSDRTPDVAHRWALRIHGVLTNHVSLVAVISQDEDNAAAVFETLNDRGIGLSTPDLLRNLLLRRAEDDTRQEIIDLWRDILELGGDPQLRAFLRHYWLSYEGDVKTQSLYREIKNTLVARSTDSLQFSRQLRNASLVYRDLLNAQDDDEETARLLSDLNELGANVVYPALLSAYDVGNRDQRRALASALLVTFVRHNVIGGLESTQLEKIVFAVARQLRGSRDFQAAITSLSGFAPDDPRFTTAFSQASVPRRATARYVLRELEKRLRTTEELDVAPPPRVHVEHIYPQQPPDVQRWSNHLQVVNRIGNLTLLARRLNTGAQNADFAAKTPYYRQSELLLTQQLLTHRSWTPAAIESRQSTLASMAANIWAYPVL